jgi:hypothetical protein
MIHHIAELITLAEQETGERKPGNRTAAIQAILAFWDHRHSVDRIDPLRDLKPLLNVIKTLDPNENRWTRMGYRNQNVALQDVYSALRDIVVFSIIAQAKPAAEAAADNALVSDEEAQIVTALNLWLAEYQKEAVVKPKAGKSRRGGRKKEPEAEDHFDASQHVLSQIAEARKALDALERQTMGLPPVPPPQPTRDLLQKIGIADLDIEIVAAETTPDAETDD